VSAGPKAEILAGYRPGLVARLTEMHALFYARAAGFGRRFETIIAHDLAAFCDRLDKPGNAIWASLQDDRIVGGLAIDGEYAGAEIAHLRWFIVDDEMRGAGLGRRLLETALAFSDAQHVAETHLWTFAGLHAARHLYETCGFVQAEERLGTRWGTEMLEQRFVRKRP
jgi:GNAT superfamily N-acetyltransferase